MGRKRERDCIDSILATNKKEFEEHYDKLVGEETLIRLVYLQHSSGEPLWKRRGLFGKVAICPSCRKELIYSKNCINIGTLPSHEFTSGIIGYWSCSCGYEYTKLLGIPIWEAW